MYHLELGKTTAELHDEEYCSNPEKNLYRSRLNQQISNVLQRRVEQLLTVEQQIEDMIEEGAPVNDPEVEMRFGVPVSEADLAELHGELDKISEAERTALEDITRKPRVIGGIAVNEASQESLFEHALDFKDFSEEFAFWVAAARKLCEERLVAGKDDFLPLQLADELAALYPISLPTDKAKHDAIMEEIAEVCTFYDGAHGYRGLWISNRLEYGGNNG